MHKNTILRVQAYISCEILLAYCDVMAVNDNLDKVPPKSGTTGVPPTLVTGRGTQGPKIGTSRRKRDRWQP